MLHINQVITIAKMALNIWTGKCAAKIKELVLTRLAGKKPALVTTNTNVLNKVT